MKRFPALILGSLAAAALVTAPAAAQQDQARWLGGSPQEAFDLCRAWDGPLVIDRTPEPWAKGAATPQQPGLF